MIVLLREAGEATEIESDAVALEGDRALVGPDNRVGACLAAGDIVGANDALGRPFAVRGKVVKGDQRGRLLGFPTANVLLGGDSASPSDGVYVGWLTRSDTGECWPAAISVGTNPTFVGTHGRRIESYVLDRNDLALYGVEVDIAFVDRLRGMLVFESVDALVRQMSDDVVNARARLKAAVPPHELPGSGHGLRTDGSEQRCRKTRR